MGVAVSHISLPFLAGQRRYRTHVASGVADPTSVSLGTPLFRYRAQDQKSGSLVNGDSVVTIPVEPSPWSVTGNTGSITHDANGLLFGGPGTVRLSGGTGFNQTAPLSLFFVFGIKPADNRYQTIFTNDNQTGWWVRNMRLGYFSTADAVGPLLTAGQMYDFELALSAPSYTIQMFQDGVDVGLSGKTALATNYFTIGGDASAEGTGGYINEVCGWAGLLTSADATLLHNYRTATYIASF